MLIFNNIQEFKMTVNGIIEENCTIKELKSESQKTRIIQEQMDHKINQALSKQNSTIQELKSETHKTRIVQEQMNTKIDLILEGLSSSLDDGKNHKKLIEKLEQQTQILDSSLRTHLNDKNLHIMKR